MGDWLVRNRIRLTVLGLLVVPFILAACGKGGGY